MARPRCALQIFTMHPQRPALVHNASLVDPGSMFACVHASMLQPPPIQYASTGLHAACAQAMQDILGKCSTARVHASHEEWRGRRFVLLCRFLTFRRNILTPGGAFNGNGTHGIVACTLPHFKADLVARSAIIGVT